MTQTPNDLARREIRVWLVRRGMTYDDLARATGLTRPQIQRRLDGSAQITANDLTTIATALRVDVATLLTDSLGVAS